MEPQITIGKRLVGKNYPPLVIAEIGINHGGSLTVAMEMALAAKRAGCEIIKHQTHIINDEMSPAAKKTIPGNSSISIWEIMEQSALSYKDELEFKNYVESLGMTFISTPFSRQALHRILDFDLPAIKIGSGECNNYPLVELVAASGKPVILSTGMNNMESIARSVEILRKHKAPYALLHCTSIYPTPYNKIRLNALRELESTFSDAVIGLSDHSLSNLPCLGAVALGASILEKHFTDHKNRPGPDIEISMDEWECSELIEHSRILFECRGGKKEILKEEQITIDFAYATVVADSNIAEGEVLNSKNLWVRRPGTGKLKAAEYEKLINGNFKAARNIAKNTHISWDDVRKS